MGICALASVDSAPATMRCGGRTKKAVSPTAFFSHEQSRFVRRRLLFPRASCLRLLSTCCRSGLNRLCSNRITAQCSRHLHGLAGEVAELILRIHLVNFAVGDQDVLRSTLCTLGDALSGLVTSLRV